MLRYYDSHCQLTIKERKMKYILIVMMLLSLAFIMSIPIHAEIDPTTMVAYWNFDEGSGKIAKDGSGNALDGDLIGNPVWIDGKVSKALAFNGLDDYVDVPTMTTPPFITFACWFKRTGPGSGGVPRLHSRGAGPWALEFGIGNTHPPVAEQLAFYIAFADGSAAGWLPVFTPEENVWYHTAISYDGTWVRIYVNGDEVYADNQWAGKEINQGISRIGGGALGDAFEGEIDEVMMFNVAITESDVNDLMSGRWAPVELSGKLASKWGNIKNTF